MKSRRVVFGTVKSEARPRATPDSGFSVQDNSFVSPVGQGESRPVVSPRVLKLLGLGLAFVCVLQLFASPSGLGPAPIEEQIKADKVLEEYQNYRARLLPDETPESVQAFMNLLQNQIHAVARGEALGNKPLAKQELGRLMLLDGGDVRSPLYKFCVARARYYR